MKTYIPPLPVAIEAKKGLELRSVQAESNKCCTPVGIRRATQLSNRQPVSIDTIKRMRAYFARHSVDRLGKGWGINSKGYQAWLCWGGDAGRDWAEKIFQQNLDASVDRNDSAMTKYKTISEEDLRDYDFDPYTEAMGEGINILSHMQFSLGKVYRGKLVAALFTNTNNSEYSFDIFVKEKYTGKGIGSSLVDDAVSEFRSLKSDGFDDLKLEVHVVSPAMRKILLRKGFYVKSGRSGNWIMVLPNSPRKARLHNNPPSPGFSKLGEGYFAKAYYDEGEVELIFQPTEIDMYGELEFDLSRELLINFRDSLPDEFKKYLPEISRKRIEFSDMARMVDGQMVRLPEIVYGMPLYDKVRGNNIALAQAISRYANSGFRSSNGVQPLMLTLTRAIAQLADKTGANLDFSLENFSQRKDGTIVFRDPLTFRSDGFCDPKISDFWPKKYSDIFSKMMPEADGSVAIDRPKGALWPNANTIRQNPPRRKLHRNEYMPDEVSDNLVQQAKMLKHHMAYLKHQASIAKKSLTRNSSKSPTYEEYLFFAADENDKIIHLSSSIIDVAKYGKRIRIAQVSCSTPAMFSKLSKELSRSEILSLLKKHDSIIIVSPLTVIVDDIKKVRVIPEQNEILLHRNAPFIPSELKKIAMTHAQMIPHHVRYVKGMLGK